MRRIWGNFTRSVSLLVLCANWVWAGQITHPFSLMEPPDYDNVLKTQPHDLHLTLTLPKDHFYQGEIIPVTLTYSNTGKDPYVAFLPNGDRSGRVQNVHFWGQDEHGQPVNDPIGWIFSMAISGGGPTPIENIGTASVTLTINQWLRFDHPGTYTVYADTISVHPGDKQTVKFQDTINIVSNKIAVTITPLPPDEEKKIVDDATQKIDAGYSWDASPEASHVQNEDLAREKAHTAEAAIEILRYLQTPAARAALRSRLDKIPTYTITTGRFDADAALLGAPDRPAEAKLILDDVQVGHLKIDSSLVGLYVQLKSYPEFMDYMTWERRTLTPADIPQRQAVDKAWTQSRKDAEKEILAATLEAAPKTGIHNLDVIWTAFLTNPSDPDYCAQAIAHQLDFSHERQLQLLEIVRNCYCRHLLPSEKDHSADFLPLVRLYLGPPTYNRDALMILSYARPDEAHDIAVKDLDSSGPHGFYFNREGNLGLLAVTLLENPHIQWTEEQKSILNAMRRPPR